MKAQKGLIPVPILVLFVVALLGATLDADAMTCPSSPTQMAVSIPNPNPPPASGNFALNIDGLLSYFAGNNITNVKGFIDHFPRVLNTHYTIVETTGALHQTSLTHPGLMVWGDGRFMINMGTNPNDPRYEVVDIAYLKDNGDWQFDAIDFRTSPPTRRGNAECIQCHGTPPRPIWGNYLDWPGMFSDNGLGNEVLTSSQASRLTQLRSQAPTSPRFHKIEISDFLFDQAGSAMHLPEHAYGPALTISNTEMGAAVGESIQKRAARSARYAGLREEYLALSYCDTYAGVLTSTKRTQIGNLITSLGGTNTGFSGRPHWRDIYRLWGLEPNHEFPIHLKTGITPTENDLNWNTGVSRLREVVDNLIVWQLGQESTAMRNVLQNAASSYPMTSCGIRFPTLYQHLEHKIYALHTLRGNARWSARTGNGNSNLGYYDIDYLRIHQSWDNVRTSLCNLVTQSIGTGTIGNPSSNTPPVANFTFAVNGLTVNFTDTSTDSNGTIASRSWNFGDGTTSTATNPTKTYSSAATRTVTLTVTDNGGATNSVSKSVTTTSTNTPPVANFTFTVSGLTVNFTDTSTDANGTISARLWTFGDGTTSTATNPTKTYSSAGTRTVSLRVTDNGGATNTVSKSVTTSTTNTPPVANFTFTTNLLTVNFTDTSTDANGTISSRLWTFGDGTTSTATNPSKTYSSAGTRTVSLRVTDNGGATNTVSKSVTVSSTAPPPVSALLKGVPRTGLSGSSGSKQYFTLHVHGVPGTLPRDLVFRTSGGTGDMDMYVKQGSIPTTTDYQCRPFTNGNNETCTFSGTVAEGSWYVMLHGYTSYSGVSLTGDYNDNNTDTPPPPPPDQTPGTVPNACATKTPVFDAPLTKGVAECVTGSPGPGFYRHFYIRLASTDAGKTLTIKMGNGTGNADMLVSTDLGLFPHEEHYAARPDIVFGSTGPTNEETVVIPNAKSGRDYLITLPAVTSHAGISIIATVQ